MSELIVNFSSMQTAAEDVRRTHNALVSQKADLERFLQNLRGTWHGGAGETWAQAQLQWDQAADATYLVLANLYQALDAAHHSYSTTEQGLQRLWGG